MNRKKITLNLSLLVFVFSFAFFFGTLDAQAKGSSKPSFYYKDYTEWLIKPSSYIGYNIKNTVKTDKVTATSSNTSIAEVKAKASPEGEYYVECVLKKAGTFKITAKIKRGSKTYTATMTAHILNYKNPIKTLKIGNDKKNYAKLFAKKNGYDDGLKISGKKKITVKTNKDYKITEIQIYYKNGDVKKIKSGDTINTKNMTAMAIQLVSTKDKHVTPFVYLYVQKRKL